MQSSSKDDAIAWGEFKYDSSQKHLRFVEDTGKSNKTSYLDVLIDFDKVMLCFIHSASALIIIIIIRTH